MGIFTVPCDVCGCTFKYYVKWISVCKRRATELQMWSRQCLNFTCFVLFMKLALIISFLSLRSFPSRQFFFHVSVLFSSPSFPLSDSQPFTMNASFQQITFSWAFMMPNTSAFNPLYFRQMYRPTFATLNICKFSR